MSLSDGPSGKYDLQSNAGQTLRDLCEDASRISNQIDESITIYHNQTRVTAFVEDDPLDVMNRYIEKREREN